MRPDPTSVTSYLASSRAFVLVDLFTFQTTHGETLRYSSSTVPFSLAASMFPGQSINASAGGNFIIGPRFGRTKLTTKIGVQVDQLSLQIMAGAADLVGNLTWQNAFALGVFDGCIVEVDRLVCEPDMAGGTPVGAIVWFQGIVGDAEVGRTLITARINSMLALMRNQMPRRLWQAQCTHVFGDAMCQFDRASMSVNFAAANGSGQSTIITGISPTPSTLYDNGTMVSLYGANSGYTRTIGVLSGGSAIMTVPFIYPVSIGDLFMMLPGCDHTITTCQNTFNNLGRHGGFPYIPPAEFAI
jgi:hypothetical protein